MLMMSNGARELEHSIIEYNPQLQVLQDDEPREKEIEEYIEYKTVGISLITSHEAHFPTFFCCCLMAVMGETHD